MKKINHSVLVVSIASAMVILGVSVVLGMRFGVTPGLLTGVSSFTLLIACILFANRHMSKKEIRRQQERKAIWDQIEAIAAQLEEKANEEAVEKQTEDRNDT